MRTKLHRCLWMILYMQKHGSITPAITKQYLGIATRTHWRYLTEIREAGVYTTSINNKDTGRMLPGTFLVAYDEALAPVRDAV